MAKKAKTWLQKNQFWCDPLHTELLKVKYDKQAMLVNNQCCYPWDKVSVLKSDVSLPPPPPEILDLSKNLKVDFALLFQRQRSMPNDCPMLKAKPSNSTNYKDRLNLTSSIT